MVSPPSRYTPIEVIGEGSCGKVCSPVTSNGEQVAIKRLQMLCNTGDARRILREIKIPKLAP